MEVKEIKNFVRQSSVKNKAKKSSTEKSFREVAAAAIEAKNRKASAKFAKTGSRTSAKILKCVFMIFLILVCGAGVSKYLSYYKSMTKEISDYHSKTPDVFGAISRYFGTLLLTGGLATDQTLSVEQRERIETALRILSHEPHELSLVKENIGINGNPETYCVICKTREYEIEFTVKYKSKKCLIVGVQTSKNKFPLDI